MYTIPELTNWIRVAEMECGFQLEHFVQVMEMLIHEPNIISPSILRAEVFLEEEGHEYRTIGRRIVPKQDRDPLLVQYIRDYGNQVVHWTECDISELPYFYPKFQSFRYCLETGKVAIDVIPFPNLVELLNDARYLKIWNRILKLIHRFCTGTMNGYEKQVYHDLIVPKIEFQDLYRELKNRHKHWADKWIEDTDPQKHVFEDISIATFLIALWRQDGPSNKRFKFLDLGCGNGFLVHLLTLEGYNGYGIDLAERDSWTKFNCDLRKERIVPSQAVFDDVEWIIGNHPDELSLWYPIIAAKSPDCKFVVIPCCQFELSGARYQKLIPELGRYKTFCNEIETLATSIGFVVEREVLRIPSTKNQCLIGRRRGHINVQLIEQLCETPIVLRKSDREKTFDYLAKKQAKLEKKV